MSRKSKYPDALDVRQVVSAAKVAQAAGVTTEIAAAVVDAHLFGITAVAASDGIVVCISGVLGPYDSDTRKFVDEHLESLCEAMGEDRTLADVVKERALSTMRVPRVDPILEGDLSVLTQGLAGCRVGELELELVDRILDSWWDLTGALGDEEHDQTIVVRRSWDVLERDFEDWLEARLDNILGCEMDLIKRQWRLSSGRVADLVMVAKAPDDLALDGLRIIVENKHGEATVEAVRQLEAYVEEAIAMDDKPTLGILIATGIGDSADELAIELGVVTRTWGELGYLDHLWSEHGEDTPIKNYLAMLDETSPWDRH